MGHMGLHHPDDVNSDARQNRVLILGAGVYQVPLIKKSREMGFYTIICSIRGNYPGFQYADKYSYTNTVDREAVLQLARNEKIDAILTTGTDVAVSTIGYVCDQLGLKGITEQSAAWVTNKLEMKRRFFHLAGYQEIEDDHIVVEQPIIIQNEIGYLSIICKVIDGCLNFLMQAKIEPGNVNVIQISPTLQATKSNFTRKHGGNSPKYLDYFLDASKYQILADQIQSEQGTRFYKKRNRNIIIMVEDDIPELDSHRWMTLGQIKELMKFNNLVNMDTRTVISCLPYTYDEKTSENTALMQLLPNEALYRSIFKKPDYVLMHQVFNNINDHKMFSRSSSRLLPLKSLKSWKMDKREIVCRIPYDFKVVFCHVEIEEREVNYWEQPLIQATEPAVIGLFSCVDDGIRKYLVCVKHELGCFDQVELGPTLQLQPSLSQLYMNSVESLFIRTLNAGKGILHDVFLSEEGGRFYHEENRNVIIDIDKNAVERPDGYFWMDFATIAEMIQFNNCVNSQLRNLMSIIDI